MRELNCALARHFSLDADAELDPPTDLLYQGKFFQNTGQIRLSTPFRVSDVCPTRTLVRQFCQAMAGRVRQPLRRFRLRAGTPLAHRPSHDIAKLAIKQPTLADAGSSPYVGTASVFQWLRLDNTSPEPAAFTRTNPA
jgi:hypothetical protein